MTDQPATHTVAFMDIGTNSLRLLVVEIAHNHSYSILQQLKESVRLGEGEFAHQRLQPDAIDRAAIVVRQFAATARSVGADEIIAIATAATREAENQHEFLDRLRAEAGIDVHVISGLEEARLIVRGVLSGEHLEGQQALCIDIGGGSTEVGVGTEDEALYLHSLKLGAIRLTNQFLARVEGPVPAALYEHLCDHVRTTAGQMLYELSRERIDLVYGSSGTIETLGEIASRMVYDRPRPKDEPLTYQDLKRTMRFLCSLPLEERRDVPGMTAARADIIIGGGAILDTLMSELNLKEIQISERGLREGLLIDYLARHGHTALVGEVSVRERSVLQLGRTCRFNEAHARHTSDLALELFDSAKREGLHALGDDERELLSCAALLHHIGAFLSHEGYQRHSHYLIGNAELLGFDQTEIGMIAAIALYHRGGLPRKKDAALSDLSPEEQAALRVMSMLMRLAESLDRSQTQNVQHVSLETAQERLVLQVDSCQDHHLELLSLQTHREAFRRTFGRNLLIRDSNDL